MVNPNLSIKVAFTISVSLVISYSSSFSIKSSLSPPPQTPNLKASASDLLSLLASPQQSSHLNPKLSLDLFSCLRFIVPQSPIRSSNFEFPEIGLNRESVLFRRQCRSRSRSEEDELVRWPPRSVLELARLAVDSGGDPAAIHRALDPTVLLVPDIEKSKENRCELTRTPYGRRFISRDLNTYLEFLFEMIASRAPAIGLNISLDRYDLFHGHLFLAVDSGRLGILFHAKEYPAYDKEVFPYNMGYCQRGSHVIYDESINLRNILWLAPLPSNSTKDWIAPGVLVVLDARPGGIIYRDIIPEYVQYARTIYEALSSGVNAVVLK